MVCQPVLADVLRPAGHFIVGINTQVIKIQDLDLNLSRNGVLADFGTSALNSHEDLVLHISPLLV